TLVDGGWAIPEARAVFLDALRQLGASLGDIKRFLVTHVHRDHFTMATVLGRELGIDVALGLGDKPALDLLNNPEALTENPFHAVLRSAGAHKIVEEWERLEDADEDMRALWQLPTTWLEGDHEITVGDRTIDAVHTPGHTPGHYVFAERAEQVLFAGDHVLPTITPSIGFTVPPTALPLGDFMASLAKVRGLPDLRVLPAHGPVAPSAHARVDELLAFHEGRLADSLALVAAGGSSAYDVAQGLGWTRHLHAFDTLDWFSRGMAAMETKAHLDLLAARGQVARDEATEGVVYRVVS
ncbi:MAG: MBL fold metallo-hydrolase, partial [Solirubrobacteraceae bacterium]|nr:MBL fold metallo-hydrolase [Solirubrobacteraceae bacterium]